MFPRRTALIAIAMVMLSHPIELELPEAIGSRGLFDASRYPLRPVTTEDPG